MVNLPAERHKPSRRAIAQTVSATPILQPAAGHGHARHMRARSAHDPRHLSPFAAMRFVGFFVVTFGIAVAAFAIAHREGLDQSWRNGVLGAAAVAAALTILDLLAAKGTRRMPTSR